jgi:hypothetical protein
MYVRKWAISMKRAITKEAFDGSKAIQVCQIFLGTIYQHGDNIPNYHNLFHTYGHKIYQMAVK